MFIWKDINVIKKLYLCLYFFITFMSFQMKIIRIIKRVLAFQKKKKIYIYIYMIMTTEEIVPMRPQVNN
jgi:hypothetical protein